jgi:flagellar assembly factor FliW
MSMENGKQANPEYRQQDVIQMNDGLVGLPDLKRWVLMEMDPPMPLKWLQSLDNPEFRIPVTEPEYFSRDYGFDLADKYVDLLDNPTAEDLLVMIVTTVHPGGEKITGNMAAPIILHTDKHLGVQCILDDKSLSMHQEIDYVIFGVAVQAFAREKNETGTETVVDTAETTEYAEKPKEALVQS